jgi:hypothetical protein
MGLKGANNSTKENYKPSDIKSTGLEMTPILSKEKY